MKVKNVKMVEQHVEKIVLAVAVAAAAYLAYSAFSSPVTVDHNGTAIKASEVTREVSTSVDNLRRDLKKNSDEPQPVTIEDFVDKYKAIANQPLPTDLQQGVAAFTPLNMGAPAGLGSSGINNSTLAILTPVIPVPTALTAEVSRGSITLEPPAAEGATPAAVPDLKTIKEVEWVMLKATYPMAKLIQSITSPQNRIPAEAQRYTFARVEVERQRQNADGSWSGRWEPVPPAASVVLPPIQLASNADPDTVKKILDDLDTGWPAVLRPSFYHLVTPPLQVQARPVAQPPAPIRRVAPPPQQPLDTGAANTTGTVDDGGAPGGTVNVAPVAPPIPIRPRPAAPKPAPTVAATPAAPAAAPPVAGPPPSESLPPEQSHQALLGEENSPIWFYDEHVKGGERYRYRMRLAIFNPLFHLDMQLKDPNAKNLPWLRSDWAVLPEPVMVSPSRQMFVAKSLNAKPNAATFRLYRWQYGHWFRANDSFVAGEIVGRPSKPPNFSEPIDYDTGYTVIAVDTEKNGETKVVLQAPNGELVTRDSAVDEFDPAHRRLDEQISKDQAPATQPATPVAGT